MAVYITLCRVVGRVFIVNAFFNMQLYFFISWNKEVCFIFCACR
ncbi:hypothetical protein C7M51_00098 [Mixta intestinalis]|uniref:Uncharacterized protein n=1 Tax=Mixta intestinalis TaxID=1615494 RepID=A0A6P1PVL2_9GAMM|nr:hypothetical protein C7M51_00098 [Mixta intestinalis]